MNQLPVYQPPAVGARAELSLKDMLEVLGRRKWVMLLCLAASLAAATVVGAHIPKKWRGEAQMVLLLRVPQQGGSAKPDYSGPLVESVETQVGMMQSNSMAQRAWDWIQNDPLSQRQLPADGLDRDALHSITVSTPRDSDLLNVSVEARSPAEAALLTNAVCQAFVQWKKDIARRDIQESADSLAAQARQAKAAMLAAERKELAYRQAHQLVDVSSQERAVIDQLQGRTSDVAALQQEMASDVARRQALEGQLRSADRAIRDGTGVRDDSLVLSLQTQLNQLEVERAETAQKYTPKYPGILPPMDAKIADIKARLITAIQGTLDNKKPSLQAQGAAVQDYAQAQITEVFTRAKLAAALSLQKQSQRQLAALPQSGMAAAQLARSAEQAAAQYSAVQAAENAARLDLEKITGNIQITQEASVPTQPFQPNPRLVLMVGVGVGALLGLTITLLLEQLDTRVRGVEEIQRLADAPVVGLLPRLSRGTRLRLAAGGTVPDVGEALSLARVNLSLLGSRAGTADGRRVLLVTSATPQEGKSLLAAQIARSFVSTGKRVLLVDAHLRRPAQTRLFGRDNGPGLAEVLSGQRELEDVITGSGVPGLSLLGSGGRPENATDLLSLPGLPALMQRIRRTAELLVIDAPDCASSADTLLLAPFADDIVLVARVGRLEAAALRDAAAALKYAGAPVSLVINGLARGEHRTYRSRCLYRPSGRPASGAVPARAGGDGASLPDDHGAGIPGPPRAAHLIANGTRAAEPDEGDAAEALPEHRR